MSGIQEGVKDVWTNLTGLSKVVVTIISEVPGEEALLTRALSFAGNELRQWEEVARNDFMKAEDDDVSSWQNGQDFEVDLSQRAIMEEEDPEDLNNLRDENIVALRATLTSISSTTRFLSDQLRAFEIHGLDELSEATAELLLVFGKLRRHLADEFHDITVIKAEEYDFSDQSIERIELLASDLLKASQRYRSVIETACVTKDLGQV